VRDTPVSEAACVGVGVGAAAAGLRPLVSITYMDFILLGLDALVNYGAKVRYKTGGVLTAPVVVKTTAGAKGQGVSHSQCLEAWLMSVPGLRVVAPSNVADAYGLMKAALQADGPVVFVDHKKLFPLSGPAPHPGAVAPLGIAAIVRPGADLTLATHGYMTRIALETAGLLAGEGVDTEVIDLRTLSPLDVDTLAASVERTGRLLTVEEGQVTSGVGAEVIARVQDRFGPFPSKRVGALAAPVSSNPVLEAACVPDVARIAAAAAALAQAPRLRSDEATRQESIGEP
jgi:pyruvate/2-oxoglutarate/acetoin dehydrogenase E1 component